MSRRRGGTRRSEPDGMGGIGVRDHLVAAAGAYARTGDGRLMHAVNALLLNVPDLDDEYLRALPAMREAVGAERWPRFLATVCEGASHQRGIRFTKKGEERFVDKRLFAIPVAGEAGAVRGLLGDFEGIVAMRRSLVDARVVARRTTTRFLPGSVDARTAASLPPGAVRRAADALSESTDARSDAEVLRLLGGTSCADFATLADADPEAPVTRVLVGVRTTSVRIWEELPDDGMTRLGREAEGTDPFATWSDAVAERIGAAFDVGVPDHLCDAAVEAVHLGVRRVLARDHGRHSLRRTDRPRSALRCVTDDAMTFALDYGRGRLVGPFEVPHAVTPLAPELFEDMTADLIGDVPCEAFDDAAALRGAVAERLTTAPRPGAGPAMATARAPVDAPEPPDAPAEAGMTGMGVVIPFTPRR